MLELQTSKSPKNALVSNSNKEEFNECLCQKSSIHNSSIYYALLQVLRFRCIKVYDFEWNCNIAAMALHKTYICV